MSKREEWIEIIKILACLLVLLGHFFQSLVKSDILIENNIYIYFEETIYLFHVPLFFICSGYVYQKYERVNSYKDYRENIKKKFLNLGIPYFTFTTFSWILKNVLSNSVNNKAKGILVELFLYPMSPYWYLYALFFLFIFIPTFKDKKKLFIVTGIMLFVKVINLDTQIMIFKYIIVNGIWFIIGMDLSIIEFKEKIKSKKLLLKNSYLFLLLFIVLSILSFKLKMQLNILKFILGLIICASVIGLSIYYEKIFENKIINDLSNFTFVIFLLHTICAAGVRILLLKIGISDLWVHIILGITCSIVAPILIEKILRNIKYGTFILYPKKYIKMKVK